MRYRSNAPRTITHELTLDRDDLAEAIYNYLDAHPELGRRIIEVAPHDLELSAAADDDDGRVNIEINVRWETRVADGDSGGAKAPSEDEDGRTGADRPGRYAVVADSGDRARTGEIAARFDAYDDADTWRFEQPNISDRASIVWVVKSGSRYLPDKTSFARDEADDDEEE